MLKISAILFYGHAHILWTYQKYQKFWLLDDFWPDCLALSIQISGIEAMHVH